MRHESRISCGQFVLSVPILLALLQLQFPSSKLAIPKLWVFSYGFKSLLTSVAVLNSPTVSVQPANPPTHLDTLAGLRYSPARS